ncbi:hypothetical protein SCUCBS95973_004464 [Sporothrix curviconia]|uniref:Uncharacterized protein n=1 Tax=Sporothrix curviconia TaxID=1260050 RepID=A0ABP0BP27_9PEZI
MIWTAAPPPPPSPANADSYILADLGVRGNLDLQAYLPVVVYLVGYVFGLLVFGPLSEHVSRSPVSL